MRLQAVCITCPVPYRRVAFLSQHTSSLTGMAWLLMRTLRALLRLRITLSSEVSFHSSADYRIASQCPLMKSLACQGECTPLYISFLVHVHQARHLPPVANLCCIKQNLHYLHHWCTTCSKFPSHILPQGQTSVEMPAWLNHPRRTSLADVSEAAWYQVVTSLESLLKDTHPQQTQRSCNALEPYMRASFGKKRPDTWLAPPKLKAL